MIVPDVNILVYAYDRSSRHHAEARAWWEELLNSHTPIGLAWVAMLGFVAALAIEYRAEIATTDTDFARFPGLRWFNPLKSRR